MAADVLGYLQSKGWPFKRAGGPEVHGSCFFCQEPPDKRGRLYINTDPEAEIPGLFKCFRCEESGSLKRIKEHYGDTVDEVEEDAQFMREILEEAATYYQRQLTDNPDVVAWLRGDERMLTTATIKKRRLGYAAMDEEIIDIQTGETRKVRTRALYVHLREKGFEAKQILASGVAADYQGRIFDSLQDMVTIPYTTAGNVVAIRGRAWPFDKAQSGMKYKTCGGTSSRLYNTDAAWNTDEVCVTEGEFDAMILEQLGFNAMGVPGARNWQDRWNGYVSTMKRVYLVFDRDTSGEEGAEKIIERFGAKIRPIHLSELGTKCDPTEWVKKGGTADEFQDLINAASKGSLLITVDEAIFEHGEVQALPGMKFGDEILDLSLQPGLQPAQLMVILAKTNTGKTILLLNWMYRMALEQPDAKFLFLSLEQTRGEWWERARRIHQFYNLEHGNEQARDFWKDRLLIVDKNRISADDFRQSVDDFEYHMGTRPIVFMDYLGYWARGFRGEAYERTSEAIMTLKGLLKELLVSCVTPHQVSRVGKDGEEFAMDAARDSGVVEETADFVLPMWSPDNTLGRPDEEKSGLVKLRLGKSRHGGKGQLLEYQFAPISLALIPRSTDQHDRLKLQALRELDWKRKYHDNFNQAKFRHLYPHMAAEPLPLDPFAAGLHLEQPRFDDDGF